jgi:hypothetical protein
MASDKDYHFHNRFLFYFGILCGVNGNTIRSFRSTFSSGVLSGLLVPEYCETAGDRMGKTTPKLMELGLIREYAAPNKILLDFDKSPQGSLKSGQPNLKFLFDKIKLVGMSPVFGKTYRSDTHGHWHCVIHVRETLTPSQTCFMQIYLGSDHAREAMNFKRARHLEKESEYSTCPKDFKLWNVLFERKLK